MEDLKRMFGAKWAYHLGDAIRGIQLKNVVYPTRPHAELDGQDVSWIPEGATEIKYGKDRKWEMRVAQKMEQAMSRSSVHQRRESADTCARGAEPVSEAAGREDFPGNNGRVGYRHAL